MTVTYYSRRIVLRGDPDRAGAAVGDYAARYGWEEVTTPADPDAGTLQETVWSPSEDVSLHFVTDDTTGLAYLYVAADSADSGHALREHVTARLNTIAPADLLASFDNAETPAQRRQALLALALGGPHELDDATFRRIRACFHDDAPEVRAAAVYATSYSPSPRCVPLLREAGRWDPAPEVREDAQLMLGLHQELGVG